ncbi:Sua5/YciO/YrdC/YwlC family translation factor [Methanobrevibacter olleyae]|uniref:L-threonylcarbamoyladenylate synthase n=2 Tax=Methanobrevibacter olleyae TaxID=294671 RepID=A0A126QY51_METOL|nr:Sua5/YciO/YrdC/YwlC family translation factor [Methanobrevibacter olleyae]
MVIFLMVNLMKVFKMSPENPDIDLINEAIDIMANGGIILYPTDTVYGLGADIFNDDAVKRIYTIKKRDPSKPLSVLVQDRSSVELIADLDKNSAEIINKCLPGPFTFILNKKEIVSPYVSPSSKVGVRVPDYKIARLLASLFPITTTSANLTNEDTLSNPQDILNQIGDVVDLVIDVGSLEGNEPSTVIDLTYPKPSLVRNGFISDKIKSIKEDVENLKL